MALIVETGAGLSNSNSYATAAQADAFFADRGASAAWTAANQTQKEQSLIAASDYIDAKFSFVGQRNSASQAMAWPRTGASDSVEGYDVPTNVVPSAVVKTAIVLAGKVLGGEVLLTDDDRGGFIKSASVGSLSVTYADGAPVGKAYGFAMLLKGLLSTVGIGSSALLGVGIGIDQGSTSDGQDSPYFQQNQYNPYSQS